MKEKNKSNFPSFLLGYKEQGQYIEENIPNMDL